MANAMADPGESGMTLLEVIVALVILSLGLASLFNTVSLGTHTASVADQQRAATAAAQSLLAELGRSRPIIDGTSDGAFPNGQNWRLDIKPLETQSPVSAPLQGDAVTLTVSWPDNSQGRSLVFDTLVLTASP
jgi:prepilin-type N-terminal cleavage/methylation domain-containing protein